MFGLVKGTIVVSFASTIGSTLAFLIARHWMRDSISRRYAFKLEELNHEIKNNGIYYLFFLRLNPIIPFFMINTLMGLTTMSTGAFFRVSQIGMLPGTLLFINAGTQLSQIKSPGELLLPDVLIAFFALGVFPLITKKLFDFAKSRRVSR